MELEKLEKNRKWWKKINRKNRKEENILIRLNSKVIIYIHILKEEMNK